MSLQDSMDDACAEGIADEHYRLEGRLWLLHRPRQNIHFIAKVHHDLTFVPRAVCVCGSMRGFFCLPPTSAAAACPHLLPLSEGL